MEKPFLSTGPTKLYAFLLKLRPLAHRGTLMPFSGELVHGAWLSWLRRAAPDVATWLHDGNKRRLFTCSSLQFPINGPRFLEAERENIHLPLDPEKTYTIRITLLLGELFPIFYEALMRFHSNEGFDRDKPPFMQIGKQLFLLEEVIISNNDPTGWSGYTSLVDMIDTIRKHQMGQNETLRFEFASLTTFNRSSTKGSGYGPHFARLPLPQYVFPSLLRRWEDIAPPEQVHWLQRDRILQYIQDEGIIILDYDLRPHHVRFTTHQQLGFVGTCKYILRGPDEPVTTEAPLTIREQLMLLARLAFYCGVGYKTSMGMGRTRLLQPEQRRSS